MTVVLTFQLVPTARHLSLIPPHRGFPDIAAFRRAVAVYATAISPSFDVYRSRRLDQHPKTPKLGFQLGVARFDLVAPIGESDDGDAGSTTDGQCRIRLIGRGDEVDVVVVDGTRIEHCLGSNAVAAPIGAEQGDSCCGHSSTLENARWAFTQPAHSASAK